MRWSRCAVSKISGRRTSRRRKPAVERASAASATATDISTSARSIKLETISIRNGPLPKLGRAASRAPIIAVYHCAASSTVRVKTPMVSSVSDCNFTPLRGTRPKVGLNPTTPQYAAGRMIEPAVCVPNASRTMPAATAAAEPEDEPPGVCSRFWGFRVLAGWLAANSVVAVLPIMTAPAALASPTHAASSVAMLPA